MLFRLDVALLATVVLAADRPPNFDVNSHCRRIASDARPVGSPDACVREEQEARAQLTQQWTQFPVADRSYCARLTSLGAEPTFTELLTCLEMRREARRLREQQDQTTGSAPDPDTKSDTK
jgi:hypothetical protein